MKKTLLLPCLTLVLSYSVAHAQTRLFDIESPDTSFGTRVVALGDLDGDGRAEFAASEPGFDAPGGSYDHGRTTIYDGASGEPSLQIVGPGLSASGWALAAAGDVDGDGTPDVIIGKSPGYGGGLARVHSGADGSLIHGITAVSSYFGAAVGAAGDVDGDGFDDFLVADTDADSLSFVEVGSVYLFSGFDASLIDTLQGATAYEHFGSVIAPAGDVDGDGHDDFAVSSYDTHTGTAAGIVRVFSGFDRSVLRTHTGGGAILELGLSLVADEDFDGDGVPDVVASHRTGFRAYSGATGALITDVPTGFLTTLALLDDLDGDSTLEVAVGARFDGLWQGEVTVYSGGTGAVLYTMDGSRDYDYFGSALDSGDVDGDGVRDLVVGAAPNSPAFIPGHVYVHTTGPRPLEADLFQVSTATGGSQVLDVDAGPANAGNFYFVLGSTSGIEPGVHLGGFVLPVNLDPYLFLTLTQPNGIIQSSLGVLDAVGQAQATVVIPADPTLAGVVGHHAFAVFSLAPLTFHATSNPVSLRLNP